MLFLNREDGQGLAEYALVLSLVAIVVVAILGVFGRQLVVLYQDIVTCLPQPDFAACYGS